MNSFTIEGQIVDIVNERIFPGVVSVIDGKIAGIKSDPGISSKNYIMPGFIDSHVHIESSMLVPSEFARMAVVHGTVGTVSDPHEIANVLGMKGIDFMLENGSKVPFKFNFGAPSCVPATNFESAGASVTADDIEELLSKPGIKYLSEMMNFPGVLLDFPYVMDKISIARKKRVPIDGHAPGLKGDNLKKYVKAGIKTDHESLAMDEALEKINLGMKILIREGSAAKDFETFASLVDTHNDMCMFCSDDKHPDDLAVSHINDLVKRALAKGYDLFNVLRVASLNPVKHYSLDIGLLQIGDPADFIIVDDLEKLNILKTFIDGKLVAEEGKTLIESIHVSPINNFSAKTKIESDFLVKAETSKIRVIKAYDGLLITDEIIVKSKIENGNIISDTENDILKIIVLNRYADALPAIGFINGFNLKEGAIATSVAHDSHNIIAVGTNDRDLTNAVNSVIESKGGLAVSNGNKTLILSLPVAGLMSAGDAWTVAETYSLLDKYAKEMGSKLNSPFMTLSFMALLVIPKLKLSDKGLFDGTTFQFTKLQVG